jgi:hypothetical protein
MKAAYFSHFHAAAQGKQSPIGENSPNLVTPETKLPSEQILVQYKR